MLLLLVAAVPAAAVPRSGEAPDCCGGASAWTTGDKSALGTAAAGTASPVWFTVADGVTSEVFYPRADTPNMQDMQYVVTDGATFTDLERDATTHVVTMPDRHALEYTVTNTARSGRYRITTTYVTDPARPTLLTRTRFQSLDGGHYRLYLLANPSMADSGGGDTASYTGGSLVASGGGGLGGTVSSALRASTGFSSHANGYSAAPSDCLVQLRTHRALADQYDAASKPGNVVQCGQIPVGTDTTFTAALGYGATTGAAADAASGSLQAGYATAERAYRGGWNAYVGHLAPAPRSVTGDDRLHRSYDVATMALHAAEDKTHPGASVASLAKPWGATINADQPQDGYYRVWGRDLYEQAIGLLAAGDTAQPRRMAQFLWNAQWIGKPTPGDGTTYQPGAFPRYSPVSGVAGATPKDLGCCEQLDEASDAIILAQQTHLTDKATYAKVKITAEHIRTAGPATTERWEEQNGRSPSSIAEEIAGLVSAGAIARANNDPASAAIWETTADTWRAALNGWTVTTKGHWGDGTYYERVDPNTDPDDNDQITFDDGAFLAHDITDFGFLEQVRLGERPATDPTITRSLAPTAAAYDANSRMQVTLPNGDVYFHRYPHDSYGESNDCTGWPANHNDRHGRLWPVLSGERGEYELAAGHPAAIYLRSMSDAANPGSFIGEQIWDRPDIPCYGYGTQTASAAPLMWAEGQYIRLAQSIDAGHPVDTPPVVAARYHS